MEKPQTFRSPTALVVWVVWLLFAVGNWVDLAVQGRDHASVVAAAILLLATGAAYVTAQRPRVIVDDTGLTIKNPVRDHRISWAAVTNVDLMDLLRVHCTLPSSPGHRDQGRGHRDQGRGQGERRKVISAWAVHYSRRRQLNAGVRARRAASARDSSTEADAKIIVRLISERATAARASTPASASPATAAASPATATAASALAPGTRLTDTPSTTATATPAPAATPGTVATDTPAAGPAELLTSTWSATAIAALVIPALILLIVILL